jgi:uncharacterized alkaline shock family protein YloU
MMRAQRLAAREDAAVTQRDPSRESATPTGRVEISDGAIISIIHEAVLSCYGVVDMAPRSLGSAIGKRLGIGSNARGIDVASNDGHLRIELSVVVEYGTPIFTVAQNVMQTVKFQVERVLGMTVDRVNVNVDGLRVSAAPGGSGT